MKMKISIVEDPGLPERGARINMQTWKAIKEKMDSAFFPESPDGCLVGVNPFDPQYIIFAGDESLPLNEFHVSSDVKKLCYSSTDFLEV